MQSGAHDWMRNLQKVQGDQGILFHPADQANQQYHENHLDPEDLKAHQHPKQTDRTISVTLSSLVKKKKKKRVHNDLLSDVVALIVRSKLTGCPSFPASPFSPWRPGGPRSPTSPCLPGSPVSPRVPFGPSLPAGPGGPEGPGLPCNVNCTS